MVGFPHSEIIGSKLIRSSPTLIAAYYVLHRLCTPRHPLNALKTLDRSHYQCPQHQHHPSPLEGSVTTSSGLSIANASLRQRLIGQIKLTRFHVPAMFLPGVRVKRDMKASLYDVERSGHCSPKWQTSKLALLISHAAFRIRTDRQITAIQSSDPNGCLVVEPDGIEPTTSCLQSRRSPS
jgi:hypothetical protein